MNLKFSALFCFLLIGFDHIESRNLYVSSNLGNDHNEGLSLLEAFKTIQYASSVSQPGDTILIASGIYKSSSKFLIKITHSGTKENWIVYKNLEITRPILYVSNEAAITISLVSYIQIEGMEITIDPEYLGKNIIQEPANNLTSKGNGIQVERSQSNNYLSHHIRIKNNYIHDCQGNGIDIFSSDYVDILYNTIQANGNFSMSSNCGIRVQFLSAFDQLAGDHIQIMYNIISEHRQQGSLAKINSSCEENYCASGIVLRNNRYDPLNGFKTNYLLPIHISNNIIYASIISANPSCFIRAPLGCHFATRLVAMPQVPPMACQSSSPASRASCK